jgi:phosphate uptake regulator
MKRKVIQLAGKTLVVSLPSKWAKKYGVRKGDEINVEEQERQLLIKAHGRGESAVKVLDAKDLEIMLERTLGGLYKAGYDEVEVTYHSQQQYSTIREVLNKTCLGYEIIRHGQRTIVIKNISELHQEEFDNILRRLFLTILSSAEDTLEYIKQGNLNGLEEIEPRDQMINRYSDLCRRILNIKGESTTKKTTTYYYICEELEKVGDAYKELAKFMAKNKMKKVDKETSSLIQDINAYLRVFYELFYQFELKKLEAFGAMSNKFKKDFAERLESSSVKDLKLTHLLYRIFSNINDMSGSLITANV